MLGYYPAQFRGNKGIVPQFIGRGGVSNEVLGDVEIGHILFHHGQSAWDGNVIAHFQRANRDSHGPAVLSSFEETVIPCDTDLSTVAGLHPISVFAQTGVGDEGSGTVEGEGSRLRIEGWDVYYFGLDEPLLFQLSGVLLSSSDVKFPFVKKHYPFIG